MIADFPKASKGRAPSTHLPVHLQGSPSYCLSGKAKHQLARVNRLRAERRRKEGWLGKGDEDAIKRGYDGARQDKPSQAGREDTTEPRGWMLCDALPVCLFWRRRSKHRRGLSSFLKSSSQSSPSDSVLYTGSCLLNDWDLTVDTRLASGSQRSALASQVPGLKVCTTM